MRPDGWSMNDPIADVAGFDTFAQWNDLIHGFLTLPFARCCLRLSARLSIPSPPTKAIGLNRRRWLGWP